MITSITHNINTNKFFLNFDCVSPDECKKILDVFWDKNLDETLRLNQLDIQYVYAVTGKKDADTYTRDSLISIEFEEDQLKDLELLQTYILDKTGLTNEE